jgi:hypothetical protein
MKSFWYQLKIIISMIHHHSHRKSVKSNKLLYRAHPTRGMANTKNKIIQIYHDQNWIC